MPDKNLSLFEHFERECDHLPVAQRKFIGDFLVCSRCGKNLRPKNYIPLAAGACKGDAA